MWLMLIQCIEKLKESSSCHGLDCNLTDFFTREMDFVPGLITHNRVLGLSVARRFSGMGCKTIWGYGSGAWRASLSVRIQTMLHHLTLANEQRLLAVKSFADKGAVDLLDEPLIKLSRGQHQVFHTLPSGLRLEVIVQGAELMKQSKAPLLFVHGSYHAAWCWACLWLPFFAARGHDCYAISLAGHGASDVPVGKVSATLESHARDLAHFIRNRLREPPVLIGHSFGGLVVQWFFSHPASTPITGTGGWEELYPQLAAAVLVCSTPPTGNRPMVKRFLQRDIVAAIKITLSLAAKLFQISLSLCRETFFSQDIPEADVKRYQKLLKESSCHPMLDLRKLNACLPLPKLPQAPPIFVLAAQNDFIVDLQGSQETAEWYGTEPVIIGGSGHDIMLDTSWEKAAEALYLWLEQQEKSYAVEICI